MRTFISRTSGGNTATGDFLQMKSLDTAAVIENHVSRFHPEAFRIRAGGVQEWYFLLVSFRFLKRWGHTLLHVTSVILTVFIWQIVPKKWDYFTYHGMSMQRNPTAQQHSCAKLSWAWGSWVPHPQTENSHRLDNKFSSQCVNGYQRIVQLQTQISLKNSSCLCHCNTVWVFRQRCWFTFSPSWQNTLLASLKCSQISQSPRLHSRWGKKTETSLLQASIWSASLIWPCCPKYNR